MNLVFPYKIRLKVIFQPINIPYYYYYKIIYIFIYVYIKVEGDFLHENYLFSI